MEFLADDELTLNKDDPRFKPKSQRGAIGDGALGALSGIAMGTVEVATAPDALIRGDKKAAQGRAQSLEIFKPNDLGAVGEFTYGLTKDFTRIGWNALTTLGTGGVPGLALNSGLFGYQTFEAEKSDLLNKGADLETARVGGAIKGVTDAASFIIPTHGVTKSVVTDAVATTALATAAGSAGDYIEGSYLEQNSNKKVAQYGEALKENALSPSTLAANGGMALLLNLWANKGRLRPEQVKEHSNLDTMNDAAHIQANIEHAEGTNPFVPTTPNEANAHFYALDSAMESALNDELVSLKAPVTGTPKAVVSSTPVVPVTGTPKAIVRPSAITADEYKEPVIAKAFSNPVFDKKPWAKTIAQEALTRGINPIDALVISHIETGGTFSTSIQPKDRNGKLLSSATGLFQTLDSTFARMGGKNKFDGNDQIKAGLNYYEHNAKVFRSHFNRDPNGLELYYLHFFGEGGGPVFLKAKDNELFVDVATRWSKGNQKKTARQIAEGITSSHQFNGMTVGQVKAKYEKRWNDIAKLYSDVSSQNAVQPTEIRGSESEFPQFESDITAPPTYKSQSDAEIEAMPFVLSADEHSVKSLQEEFEALSSPLTKEDLEYLKATAHYQYSESGAYRTPYVVEPQVDLSGPSNSANRTLDTLDFDIQQIMPEEQRAILAEPEANTLNINTRQPEQGIQQKSITQGIDNWAPTRSSNYLKREQVLEDGRFVQELHNKASNTTFQREVNQDGTISPVKATRNGNDLFAHSANGKANSPELTAVQHKATQALEREFWRPSNSNKVDGTPDLTKSSKGDYGAFTDTADGREAVSILEADLDMEITFTRLDENGNEEVVTMSSRDLLDYVKEQEEIAKDEIQAVKALASCALKFGSEAA